MMMMMMTMMMVVVISVTSFPERLELWLQSTHAPHIMANQQKQADGNSGRSGNSALWVMWWCNVLRGKQ